MIFIHELSVSWPKPCIPNIININWDAVNRLNDILYDKIALVIDVKRTKENLSVKHSTWYYYPILRSIDYDYYYESNYTFNYNYKSNGHDLEYVGIANRITESYYSDIDNQGNVEFTPVCCLEDKIKMELREEVRGSFHNYNLDLFNRIASANRNY